MGFGKWLGGFIGLLQAGPLGALLGFAVGAMFDNFTSEEEQVNYAPGSSSEQVGMRNGFLFSLLVLISYIIKADGRVMHSEMEYVRRMLRSNFGENAVVEGEDILKRLFERQKQMDAQQRGSYRQTVMDSCAQIRSVMTYEQRLQLLALLAEVAKADGNVAEVEIQALREVANALGLNSQEVDSMLNLGGQSLEAAYKVLEISPSATDDEVKKAYRKMALKHHPDRVATLGDDIKKAAEKKFQEINAAKDLIFKARGL